MGGFPLAPPVPSSKVNVSKTTWSPPGCSFEPEPQWVAVLSFICSDCLVEYASSLDLQLIVDPMDISHSIPRRHPTEDGDTLEDIANHSIRRRQLWGNSASLSHKVAPRDG